MANKAIPVCSKATDGGDQIQSLPDGICPTRDSRFLAAVEIVPT